MGEGIVTVLILLPIRTATRLEDNTLALAMAVRHFAQVGFVGIACWPSIEGGSRANRKELDHFLFADHSYPHTASLYSRLESTGSGCPLAFSSGLVSILRRACTANPAEHPRKVLLRFETACHGDIQDTRLRRAQQLLRTLYSVA